MQKGDNMLEKFLDDYVDRLYLRQNEGACKEQLGLYSKKEYYELLRPVVEVISSCGTLDEMRNKLFYSSKIQQKVEDIIYKKEMVPGMVFSYGTNNYKETIVIGNKQEITLDKNGNLISALEKMTHDTIFDLASITKLFTGLSILKLVQNGTIKLDDEVIKYAYEFKNLKGVTIFDLISFSVPLKTSSRVDKALSKEEALDILFNIEVDKTSDNKKPYTDMGAMVLKYVIEHASEMNYYDFVKENILDKAKMIDTHVFVPKMKLDRVASTNFDGKYYKDGNFIVTTSAIKGVAYDPKAQIMGQLDGDLSGHAGLFSTSSDMVNLAKNIMSGQIINDEYVLMMAKNRTGRKYIEDDVSKYVQYLGMMCYSKNPILANSELFHAMSGRAFASSGWTGTQLTVDPVNQIYLFLGANRSHNRMTFIDPIHKDKIKIDEFGKKTIMLPNGKNLIDATRFAWDRDYLIIHPTLKLSIQYKMLEDIFTFMNEKIKPKEKIISL